MIRPGIYDNKIDDVYDADNIWSFLHCLYLVTLCGQLFHLCFISHQSAACSCVHDLFCHCDKVTGLIQTISWVVALVLPSNLREIIPIT